MEFQKAGNPLYLYEAVLEQMRANFKSSKPNALLLNDFFTKIAYKELATQILTSKKKHAVPDRYSYTEMVIPSPVEQLFNSESFLAFLREATGKKITNVTLQAQQFSAGDYTLLHDAELSEPGTEFFIIFSDTWKPEWGGSTIYTPEKADPLIFVPIANTFSLITTTKYLHSFVKYLNYTVGPNSFIKLSGRLL